jgi:ribosomal protein S18 acetylase RimI-like enzyme
MEELAPVPWDDATKRAFLEQQFTAQDAHYRQNYTGTSYDVILAGEEPAGRLYVARWKEEIRIVDIALLPDHRGKGMGAALLRDLMAEADAGAKALTIHVETNNPARSLYERLGFRPVEERSPPGGVYVLMERLPVS